MLSVRAAILNIPSPYHKHHQNLSLINTILLHQSTTLCMIQQVFALLGFTLCSIWICCSVAKSCPTLCDPMDCSTSGSSVLHYILEFAHILVYWVSDANQPSHPLSPPSPFAFNISQHQGLFQWVGFLHQVAKVLELQHESFQWKFRVDFL